jgi:hypothetical protein
MTLLKVAAIVGAGMMFAATSAPAGVVGMAGPRLAKPDSQVEKIRYVNPKAIIGRVVSGVLGGIIGGDCYFNDCGYDDGPYYGGGYGGGYGRRPKLVAFYNRLDARQKEKFDRFRDRHGRE